MSEQYSGSVWVVGEALMDLIPYKGGPHQPMVGGGPANTAKALAQLGHKTYFIGGISHDEYGQKIMTDLSTRGVDLSLSLRSKLPTALAIATIDDNGLARYEFELEGTASFAFNTEWLPSGSPDVIHVGSVATLLEPGSSALLAWVKKNSAPVILDPNVRPSIEADRARYRAAIQRWVAISSIIKLSEEDFDWLYETSELEVIRGWLRGSVRAVIVTRGGNGISAYTRGSVIDVPAVEAELVDSVGAGDTVGAIIAEGVLQFGVQDMIHKELKKVLLRSVKAAAITCSRVGANPPTRIELENF